MRLSLLLPVLLALALLPARGADAPAILSPSAPAPGPAKKKEPPSVVPAATTADRYKPIWVRSPFSVASATDEPGGDWVMTGLASDGGGPVVFLFNRQNQKRIMVTGQADGDGFSVESIDYKPDYLESSARIKTPAETITVKFDKNLVAAAATAAPAGPGPAPGLPAPGGSVRAGIIGMPPSSPGTPPRILIPNPISSGQIPRPTPHP